MSVKLRLKRMGRTHTPYYRLSVMDTRTPRDGRVLEELGTYDPANKQAEQQVRLNAERVMFWLGRGATPTDTVRSLLRKNGLIK